jgi:DNA adenine methylase (dam)
MKIPQLLKWIGSKNKYAEQIISLMPNDINNYIEPFLGSGSILANLANKNINSNNKIFNRAIGADILTPLIGIFNEVKNNPTNVSDYYESAINEFNNDRENTYLKIRERFNTNRNPLDFMVLTRTCYSGVIRFRKSDGYMSTPIGPHNPIPPEKFKQRVGIWNNLLKDITIIESDFRNTIDMATNGDLIYCDPPYTHSQGILYGAQDFNIEELWNSLRIAKGRGARIMLSINGTKKSKKENIGIEIPYDIFERYIYIDCGISMINRLQREGQNMIEENVNDMLLFSW